MMPEAAWVKWLPVAALDQWSDAVTDADAVLTRVLTMMPVAAWVKWLPVVARLSGCLWLPG